MKILFFDGSGLCLFYKRLDRGTFRWPTALEPGAKSITLHERALDALLDGIDIDLPARKRSRSRAH
jgi:transposase